MQVFLYLGTLLGLQFIRKVSMILPSLGKESNMPLLFNQHYGKWCILGSCQGSAQDQSVRSCHSRRKRTNSSQNISRIRPLKYQFRFIWFSVIMESMILRVLYYYCVSVILKFLFLVIGVQNKHFSQPTNQITRLS